jgi:predicted nucleic acid-binding protein
VIFVDANVFLRFFVVPGTPQDRNMALQSAELFRRVRDEEEEISTSEAVIAEVAFIATSKTHYGMTRGDVADLLKSVLQLSACKLPGKSACLRALDVWVAHPKLSFPDALGAAYSEELGFELATFDDRLTRVPDVILYTFPIVAKNGNGTMGN